MAASVGRATCPPTCSAVQKTVVEVHAEQTATRIPAAAREGRSRVHTEVPTRIDSEVPARVHTQIPARVHTQVATRVHAEVPTRVHTEVDRDRTEVALFGHTEIFRDHTQVCRDHTEVCRDETEVVPNGRPEVLGGQAEVSVPEVAVDGPIALRGLRGYAEGTDTNAPESALGIARAALARVVGQRRSTPR